MKCVDCGKKAVYSLPSRNGEFRVCADCDEDYSICGVCQTAVPLEEMRYFSPEDEYMICYDCIPAEEDENNEEN